MVEDDEALRLYTVEVLSDLGYSVLAAANAAAALEIIGRGPQIDLLFTDIVMPGGMNGRQLGDERSARCPSSKFYLRPGTPRMPSFITGRLDPDIELISKPFTY